MDTSKQEEMNLEYDKLMSYVGESEDPDEALFWAFLYLRQNAWARKCNDIQKPYTADPIIAEWRFTNIYRELDRGTLYCANEILEKVSCAKNAFVLATIYRYFNRIDTWQNMISTCWPNRTLDEVAEILLTEFGRRSVYEFFHAKQKQGVTLFTGAYQCTAAAKIMHENLLDELLLVAAAASQAKYNSRTVNGTIQTMKSLSEVQYVGEFTAFQVAMDVSIDTAVNEGPWQHQANLDGDVAIGPGSKAGTKIIRPDMPALTCVKYLRENAEARLLHIQNQTGIRFVYPRRFGEKLKLRSTDIEHGLCEFAKYHRVMVGGRSKSRLSTPPNDSWRPNGYIPKGWL